MRIERVEVVPYALPFREPYVTVRGRIERRELALLRLHTDAGPVGLGEAAPLIFRGGLDIRATVDQLRTVCGPVLEAADLSELATPAEEAGVARARIRALLTDCEVRGASPQAIAAVDLGLHDLAGKHQRVPLWRLLEATHARPVPCNATLVAAAPERVAASAASWADDGFETFKLKVELGSEPAQVAEVRRAVGDAARIRVDVNGAWPAADAPNRAHELETFDVELLEQPTPDLSSMAALRHVTTIPLAADESVATEADAQRAAELGACDVVSLKLAEAGGILAAGAIAAHLPVYLSSALDGPLGIAAAGSLAQTLPRTGFAGGLAYGLATARLFDGDVAAYGWTVDRGLLHPSPAPGLGVEIDDDALDRHRI
jgi:muconate cycloisomerase